MAKKESNLASVLSFEKKLVLSDAGRKICKRNHFQPIEG